MRPGCIVDILFVNIMISRDYNARHVLIKSHTKRWLCLIDKATRHETFNLWLVFLIVQILSRQIYAPPCCIQAILVRKLHSLYKIPTKLVYALLVYTAKSIVSIGWLFSTLNSVLGT